MRYNAINTEVLKQAALFNSAPPDGVGLGLAIARRAVEAEGGTIEAANAPGGGLVVTIALPMASQY